MMYHTSYSEIRYFQRPISAVVDRLLYFAVISCVVRWTFQDNVRYEVLVGMMLVVLNAWLPQGWVVQGSIDGLQHLCKQKTKNNNILPGM